MERIDLTGRRFGRLTVIEYVYTKKRKPYYKVKCDCGKTKIVCGNSMVRGLTQSCGCLRNERVRNAITKYTDPAHQRFGEKNGSYKHGLSKHPLYHVYREMIARCYRESHHAYKYYGARGIGVCDEWKNDFMSFFNWSIENGWEDKVAFGYKHRIWTLDRIDCNKGYSPDNCRYASAFMQANNTRRNHTDRVSYLDREREGKKS